MDNSKQVNNGSSSSVTETADIETSSDAYAARFSGPVGAWMLAVQEQITLKLLSKTPRASVLDVGGGHGQLAAPLCREGFSVTVLASSESCKNRINSLVESGACKFKAGNVVEIPFPDQSFDTVTSFRLLPHCDTWPRLIGELCRTAKQSVIIDYPTSQSLNKIAPALFKAKNKIEKNTRPFRLFTHQEVISEFEKHGFVLNKRKGEFFLPMVLHRMLRCKPMSVLMEALCRGLGLASLWGSPVIVEMKRGEILTADDADVRG